MTKVRFDPTATGIVVEVKLSANLIATTRMIFDTGASFLLISNKLARDIGLKIDLKKTLKTTTASSVETAPLVIIPKVSVLDSEIKNVEALVMDLPPESGISGLLGLSFIKHFNVNIDFKHGKLTLKK